MGSNLLKAWWLLPLHISKKNHPCDTPINTDAYLHLQETFFSFLELRVVILKQRKAQDYKQQGYYMISRCKNYTVADTSMYIFFSSPMLRLWFLCLHGSCQGLHETTCCAATLHEHGLPLMLLGGLMAEPGSGHLPRSVAFWAAPSGHIEAPVGTRGIAQAHRAPALGTDRRAPSATAGLSAWMRQAGFEPPGIEKGPHAHLPQLYPLSESKEKDVNS